MDLLRRLHRFLGGRWLFVVGFALFFGLYEYGRVLHLRPLHADDWLMGVGGGMVTGLLAALLPPRRPVKRG